MFLLLNVFFPEKLTTCLLEFKLLLLINTTGSKPKSCEKMFKLYVKKKKNKTSNFTLFKQKALDLVCQVPVTVPRKIPTRKQIYDNVSAGLLLLLCCKRRRLRQCVKYDAFKAPYHDNIARTRETECAHGKKKKKKPVIPLFVLTRPENLNTTRTYRIFRFYCD